MAVLLGLLGVALAVMGMATFILIAGAGFGVATLLVAIVALGLTFSTSRFRATSPFWLGAAITLLGIAELAVDHPVELAALTLALGLFCIGWGIYQTQAIPIHQSDRELRELEYSLRQWGSAPFKERPAQS
jgi:hypothetical protein